MRDRTNLIKDSTLYTIQKSRNRKTGKIKYILRLKGSEKASENFYLIRKHFTLTSPQRWDVDWEWRYHTIEEAEQQVSLAVLKGLL